MNNVLWKEIQPVVVNELGSSAGKGKENVLILVVVKMVKIMGLFLVILSGILWIF